MKLIICTDSNNGILFNKRRQSRDSAVINRIVQLTSGSTLYISEYSLPLFENVMHDGIVVCDDFLQKVTVDDFVFVEKTPIVNYEHMINELCVFNWNRIYPADTYLGIDLLDSKWSLVLEDEFAGSSHDRITLSKYVQLQQPSQED